MSALHNLYRETVPIVQHVGGGEYVEILPLPAAMFALVVIVASDVDTGNHELVRAGLLLQVCQPRISTDLAAWLVIYEARTVSEIIGAAMFETMRGYEQ